MRLLLESKLLATRVTFRTAFVRERQKVVEVSYSAQRYPVQHRPRKKTDIQRVRNLLQLREQQQESAMLLAQWQTHGQQTTTYKTLG